MFEVGHVLSCVFACVCCVSTCVCQVSSKKCPAWTLIFSQVPTMSHAILSRQKFVRTAICSLTALICIRSRLIQASFTSGCVNMSWMRNFKMLILFLFLQIHADSLTIRSFLSALLIFGLSVCDGRKRRSVTLCLYQCQMRMV